MKIVFIHQNMPGQYKHLAPHVARDPRNQVVFITKRTDRSIPGVRRVTYQPHRQPSPGIHHYLVRSENAVLHGQAVARILMDMRRQSFVPDVIVSHGGWGEALYAKDIFPDAPLLNYCEFYYNPFGQDIGFDPDVPATEDMLFRARTRNAHLLLTLDACDRGVAPTVWQRDVHPAPYRPKIEVVHDGIDTVALRPRPDAAFTLPSGRVLSRTDEVVTYVARNLEPYRGFDVFMRALPTLLDARPNARVLIVGGDEVSYGSAPAGAANWREKMLAEVAIDPERVSFLGYLPYPRFVELLRVSSVHVYLTYPFVLSWSMLEAMALGCVMVCSRTAPVEEVVTDGVNGLLVDFFDPEGLARRIAEVLADREGHAELGRAARRTVEERYALADCLRRQTAIVTALAGR